VHESILLWQDRVLEKLLSPLTLTRLHDSERQISAEDDAFTVAELLERLTADIFAETSLRDRKSYTNRQPAISSLRRGLQFAYLDRMAQLALERAEAPSDCQSLALLELTRLRRRIEDLLQSDVKLDRYTLAHLTAASSRISMLLDRRMAQIH